MRIDIQARGFGLTEGPRDRTLRSLQFALGWAGYDLRKDTVRLLDINRPRAGEKRCCRRQLAFPGTEQIEVIVSGGREKKGSERRRQGGDGRRPAMTEVLKGRISRR